MVVALIMSNAPLTMWLVLAAPLFVMVRPWMLGVFLTEDGFVVRSWFRDYRVRSRQVVRIDLSEVYSAMLGAGTSWLPLAGAVRMVQLDLDGRPIPKYFPSTLGQRNAVLRLVRQLRTHCAAPTGGDITL